VRHQLRLDPREDGAVGLHIDQVTRARDRRVVRRGVLKPDVQESTNRQRVCGAPRDAALGVQAFDVADQQHAEVAARREPGAAHARRVEAAARVLDVAIEARRIEDRIEPGVERMPRAGAQLRRRNPERCLLVLPRAHRHAPPTIERDQVCRSQGAAQAVLSPRAARDSRGGAEKGGVE
jgi:hypothetical protein